MCGWSRGAEEIMVGDRDAELGGSQLMSDKPLLEDELPGY